MKVRNVHERSFHSTHRVGRLIDSLASPADALWPVHSWPRMALDRPLEVRAAGGHGPIRYTVEEYQPGRTIRFRFTGPKGFNGSHRYEVVGGGPGTVVLRHVLEMTTSGLAVLSWPFMYRPLHDALIEDSLATAQAAFGDRPTVHPVVDLGENPSLARFAWQGQTAGDTPQVRPDDRCCKRPKAPPPRREALPL